MSSELLTAKGLAERLGVRPSTIRRWQREGRIPGVRISAKVVRYDFQAVLEAVNENNRKAILDAANSVGLPLQTGIDLLEQAEADHAS